MRYTGGHYNQPEAGFENQGDAEGELMSPASHQEDMEMIEETDEAYDAANTYQDLPKEAVKDLD